MESVGLEHQSIIRFLIKERNGQKLCEQCLDMYGDAAAFEYQLKYWSKQFHWVKNSLKMPPPLPKNVSRNVQKVQDLATHMKVFTFAKECSVLEPSVLVILRDGLSMSEIRSHCFHRMPTPEVMQVSIFGGELWTYEIDPETFLSRIIRGDIV
jgi:hypothetical protein